MRFRIEHIVVQTDDLGILKQQVKVLERLGEPETLHLVLELQAVGGRVGQDAVDGRVAVLGARDGHDGFEHVPAVFAPDVVAREPPHDEDGLDGFGT